MKRSHTAILELNKTKKHKPTENTISLEPIFSDLVFNMLSENIICPNDPEFRGLMILYQCLHPTYRRKQFCDCIIYTWTKICWGVPRSKPIKSCRELCVPRKKLCRRLWEWNMFEENKAIFVRNINSVIDIKTLKEMITLCNIFR